MTTLCPQKEASSFLLYGYFDIYYFFCTWITLTAASSIIKFNHHTWAALTLWWRSCDAVLLLLLINNAELNGLRWTTRSQSQQYASGIAVSQHVWVQMAETLNISSDWHQLAIHKLADWAKLLCFNFVVISLSCMTKNAIFAQTLLHKVKQ